MIFEKRDLAGGRAYVYRDDGFTFDAGPTVITAPDCLRELFSPGRQIHGGLRGIVARQSVLSAILGGWLPVRLFR